MPLSDLIAETAGALGMNPVDLATIISFETGGTFNPTQLGPKTKWGQHKGLIQWGEPQAQQYGVNWDDPVRSQLGADGAIVRYFNSRGWKPGMDGLNAYSIVNAGSPGRFDASDAAAGGTWGTVRDKWEKQMGDHRAKAAQLLGGQYAAPAAGQGAADLTDLFSAGVEMPQIALPQRQNATQMQDEQARKRRQAFFGSGGLADIYGT